MTTRIHILLTVAIVVGFITTTIDCDLRSQTTVPHGTPLINVFKKPETRPLAFGHRYIDVKPEGYQHEVTVVIEKDKEDSSSAKYGGMCIESGNPVDLSRYKAITLSVSVDPIEIADRLEYKLEQGDFGLAAHSFMHITNRNENQVHLTIPSSAVSQGTNRFCVAMLFSVMGDTGRKTMTLSDIRFWTQNPSNP